MFLARFLNAYTVDAYLAGYPAFSITRYKKGQIIWSDIGSIRSGGTGHGQDCGGQNSGGSRHCGDRRRR